MSNNKNLTMLGYHLAMAIVSQQAMEKMANDPDSQRHIAETLEHHVDSAKALIYIIRQRLQRPITAMETTEQTTLPV